MIMKERRRIEMKRGPPLTGRKAEVGSESQSDELPVKRITNRVESRIRLRVKELDQAEQRLDRIGGDKSEEQAEQKKREAKEGSISSIEPRICMSAEEFDQAEQSCRVEPNDKAEQTRRGAAESSSGSNSITY
jgi:hypothetical protein